LSITLPVIEPEVPPLPSVSWAPLEMVQFALLVPVAAQSPLTTLNVPKP
jgi:hypothetical protein